MELAAKYCNCIMPESAWKKFRRWMHLYPGLMEQLAAIGYTERSRSFTPAQVRLIVDALGGAVRLSVRLSAICRMEIVVFRTDNLAFLRETIV